jgi:hypothetical protein
MGEKVLPRKTINGHQHNDKNQLNEKEEGK